MPRGPKSQPRRQSGKGRPEANAGSLIGQSGWLDFIPRPGEIISSSFIHLLDKHPQSPYYGQECGPCLPEANLQCIRCWCHGGKTAGQQDRGLRGWRHEHGGTRQTCGSCSGSEASLLEEEPGAAALWGARAVLSQEGLCPLHQRPARPSDRSLLAQSPLGLPGPSGRSPGSLAFPAHSAPQIRLPPAWTECQAHLLLALGAAPCPATPFLGLPPAPPQGDPPTHTHTLRLHWACAMNPRGSQRPRLVWFPEAGAHPGKRHPCPNLGHSVLGLPASFWKQA